MKFSCCVLTYCRVPHLNEALACLLAQKDVDFEIVILNTFPEQTLKFDHPLVKIINCKTRPNSLGEMRNMCIEAATGDWIITADDDDLYLPHYLSTFAKYIKHGHGWIWQEKEFYSEGWQVKGISHGTPNIFAFTKEAWKTVGGYEIHNVGEDKKILGKITKAFIGHRAKLSNDEIGFVRGFSNEVYHVSGQGESPTALDRVAEHANGMIDSGQARRGEIVLEPKLEHDIQASVKSFLYGMDSMNIKRRGTFGIILLGRYGDLINILPVCKFIADKWSRPMVFVSREFASVLDGVSYVTPMILDLQYDQVNEAVQIAKKETSIQLVAQVWGKNFGVEKTTSAFNVESWKMCGFLNEFNNVKDFPLVIDRRSREREDKLIAPFPVGRPIVLLSLNCGHSSPFANGRKLAEMLTARWNERCLVIDLCDVKAERIYDVLALYDKAAVLVTSDTAHLHLAAASKVPVISLVNDSDWSGSESRCNKVLRLRYSEAFDNLAGINKVIAEMVK